MTEPVSGYLFSLTNSGAERALKLELETMKTGWRPGYQRRGFVTFKAPSEAKPFTRKSLTIQTAFSRRLCLSLGKFETREEALQCLRTNGGADAIIHQLSLTNGRLELLEPPAGAPEAGQPVGTMMDLAPGEYWAGLHWHAPFLSPDPGGCGFLTLPEDAPSRAWLKLEEAARFFGLTFSPADIAVELGCAPGGVILALLHRGVSVIGVDPARLAPVVMTHAIPELPAGPHSGPWVFHCRKPAALVAKRDLSVPVTWFMSDMNQSPEVALKECARFIKMCPSIHSALITLKLTDLSAVVRKESWFEALAAMGFRTVRLQQLCVHNRELALLAQNRGAENSRAARRK